MTILQYGLESNIQPHTRKSSKSNVKNKKQQNTRRNWHSRRMSLIECIWREEPLLEERKKCIWISPDKKDKTKTEKFG